MSEYWRRVKNIRGDDNQRDVFDQDISRVVIAGPGSGKTYLLTTKIAKLLHTGVVKSPYRIACLTYSNFLANQLKEDLQALEILDDERIFVGTAHSFCIAEVILPFQKLYQLRVPTPLRIASWEEMLNATKDALVKQNFQPPKKKFNLEDLTRKLSNYRRFYWDTEREDFPENPSIISDPFHSLNWAQFSTDYSASLWNGEDSSVDFVHLEIETLKTIKSHSLVQQSLAARYSWWVIDEYQDLGQPFHQIMLCLLQNTKANLLAIGDPDQCIYEELQGSKPDLIYDLSKEIQEQGGAASRTLLTNYRSTQQIINLSTAVLGSKRDYQASKERDIPISFFSCIDESSQKKMILRLLTYLAKNEKGPHLKLNEIAILHPSRKGRYWKGEIGINDISIMLDRKAWANILDKDPEYNERRVKLVEWIEKLAQWCAKENITSRPYFIDLLPAWIELLENHKNFTILEERFRYEKQLFEVLWNLRRPTISLEKWLGLLRKNLQLDPIIKSYETVRPDDAKEFFKLCDAVRKGNRLPNWNIAQFAKVGSRIQLTTLHSSKGAQFEAVIMAGFDRIGFGDRKYSPKDLDKRLAYVGVSRAKKHLFILHSNQNAYFASKLLNDFPDMVEFFEYNGEILKRMNV